MKVCVVGAGAIGGYMAVRIAKAGHDVSVIARGPHLAAIRTHGLKLVEADQELVVTNLSAGRCPPGLKGTSDCSGGRRPFSSLRT